MWGPRLKYLLGVPRRPPGDVGVSALGSFHGWSPGGFSEVPPDWPLSLVATLPHMRVTWRGYAALFIGPWIVADRCGNSAF
jgi:hypothetical protein